MYIYISPIRVLEIKTKLQNPPVCFTSPSWILVVHITIFLKIQQPLNRRWIFHKLVTSSPLSKTSSQPPKNPSKSKLHCSASDRRPPNAWPRRHGGRATRLVIRNRNTAAPGGESNAPRAIEHFLIKSWVSFSRVFLENLGGLAGPFFVEWGAFKKWTQNDAQKSIAMFIKQHWWVQRGKRKVSRTLCETTKHFIFSTALSHFLN